MAYVSQFVINCIISAVCGLMKSNTLYFNICRQYLLHFNEGKFIFCVCLQLAETEMLQHETDNTIHLELLTEHISTLELENSQLKGRIEVLYALSH